LEEKEFNRELKKRKIAKEDWPKFISNNHSHATTHFFASPDGDSFSTIVCLDNSIERPIEQIYALLVHEAVHIWQDVKELIGEKEPSSEFEAYSLQQISQNLMFAYKGLTEK